LSKKIISVYSKQIKLILLFRSIKLQPLILVRIET